MDQKQNLAIVPTFGPGTLLVRSRELRVPSWGANVLGADPTDGERPGSRFYRGSSPTSGNVIQPRLTPNPPTQTRNSSSYSQRRSMLDNIRGGSAPLPSNLNFLGQTLSPLFCISLCEHAWLTSGYGVWGKEEYLKRFWGVLDWDKVGRNFDYFSSIL
jgi:Fe-Mn family superoxide dismutase